MSETRTVAKAILVNGDKILALKRSKTDVRRPLQWDLPGGALDVGEDVKQACAREVYEEAGITVAPADFKTIYAMTEPVTDGVSSTFIFFMAATNQTEVVLSEEHEEAEWMSFEHALQSFSYDRHQRLLQYVLEHNLLQAQTSD